MDRPPIGFNESLAVTGVFFEFDTLGLQSIAIQLVGTWVGTVNFEQSNDGINWLACPGYLAASIGNQQMATAATANGAWVFPLVLRKFRARFTRTSGTCRAIAVASDFNVTPANMEYVMGAVLQTFKNTFDAAASGNSTTFVRSAATTNLTLIKNTAGNIIDIVLHNTNAALRYLKLYNKASAPVLTSDVPALIVPLPPGVQTRLQPYAPIRFSTGIAYALVTGIANTDATAVAADEITGIINWA